MTTEERPARLHEAAVPPPEVEPPWHTAARHSAAPPPGVAPGVQGRRAGFVTRALANAVDLALVVTLLLLGYLAFAGIQFLAHPRSFHFPSPGLELLVPVGGLLLAAYFALSWTTVGRTYGDQVLGLRVVTHRGGRPGWPSAGLRALLCVVFPIGLLWVLVSSRNRSLQDVVLRSSVVYDWSGA